MQTDYLLSTGRGGVNYRLVILEKKAEYRWWRCCISHQSHDDSINPSLLFSDFVEKDSFSRFLIDASLR